MVFRISSGLLYNLIDEPVYGFAYTFIVYAVNKIINQFSAMINLKL